MRDYVLLFINGVRCEVRGDDVFQSLSDFLRYQRRLTGTKVVCAEGDCGSCTVLIGRPRDGRIEYRPVTSCIQFVAQLDGCHVISVEGLAYDGKLNPIQEAMIAEHGAQCGYCTPGMVASLCGLFDRSPQPSREEATRALVGNLCRCTGYDSILTAVSKVDRDGLRPIRQLYPDETLLPELEIVAKESLEICGAERTLFKPATLADAIATRAAHQDTAILSGGTDLGVLWNKGKRELRSLLCLTDVPELRGSSVTNGIWSLGAGTTIAELEREALEVLPEYGRMLERFGSPPIKNAGTLGGNLANGSPIGDSLPALFVLDAEVELIGPGGSRRVNLNQFYTGYRRSVLQSDELIRAVHIPLPAAGDAFGVYKISRRRDLDISTFTAAIVMRVDDDVIRAARIAYGGVAATVLRLNRTEEWLIDRPLTELTLQHAGQLARQEIKPLSDVRGSSDYRLQLAENILVKFGRQFDAKCVSASNGRQYKPDAQARDTTQDRPF